MCPCTHGVQALTLSSAGIETVHTLVLITFTWWCLACYYSALKFGAVITLGTISNCEAA